MRGEQHKKKQEEKEKKKKKEEKKRKQKKHKKTRPGDLVICRTHWDNISQSVSQSVSHI